MSSLLEQGYRLWTFCASERGPKVPVTLVPCAVLSRLCAELSRALPLAPRSADFVLGMPPKRGSRAPYSRCLTERARRRANSSGALPPRSRRRGLRPGSRRLLGEGAPSSATTVARLKEEWHAELARWRQGSHRLALRRLCLPNAVNHWSLRSVQIQLIKIGGRLVCQARRPVFQLAEVAVPREVFRQILERIGGLHAAPG